jgi:hypothetical protein
VRLIQSFLLSPEILSLSKSSRLPLAALQVASSILFHFSASISVRVFSLYVSSIRSVFFHILQHVSPKIVYAAKATVLFSIIKAAICLIEGKNAKLKMFIRAYRYYLLWQASEL